MTRRIGFTLVVGILLAGCAMHEKKVEQQMHQPINCATAQGDIRVLKSEKANVESQIAQGVTAIDPAGIVIGLVTGTEVTKAKVASGEYNKMIDQRIAEIKQTCGIQ